VFTLTKEYVMSTNLVVELVSTKCFVSWGEASRIILGRQFRPTDSKRLIEEFNRQMQGADALLVDSECRYSSHAPVGAHTAWLKANGYTRVPEVKAAKSAENAKARGLFVAERTTREVSNVEKEIAELRGQLAAVLAALAAKAA
jgi:hypothetical protein